jgi:hypothetical protein
MVFDARVIGLPDYAALVREIHGREGASALNRKLDAARNMVSDRLEGDVKREALELWRKPGEAAAHICLERYGMLTPLEEWARDRCESRGEGSFESLFPQLATLGGNDALILPVDFATPLAAEVKGRVYPYPVCSAQHLLAEIETCNHVLKVEKSFQRCSLPSFMHASKYQLSAMESQEGLDTAFWAKFGLLVLRQLLRKSIEAQLPLIFAERLVVAVWAKSGA